LNDAVLIRLITISSGLYGSLLYKNYCCLIISTLQSGMPEGIDDD